MVTRFATLTLSWIPAVSVMTGDATANAKMSDLPKRGVSAEQGGLHGDDMPLSGIGREVCMVN